MDFGYEERSRRLIDRLDRIKSFLSSVPPLPKLGSDKTAGESVELRDNLGENSVKSVGGEKSPDSRSSKSTTRSLSTRASRTIPIDRSCELVKQSAPTVDSSNSGSDSRVSAPSRSDLTKKPRKKRRAKRILDPLRQTSLVSFGVDIGQGINTINYIKQNAVAGADSKNKRLTAVITKEVHYQSGDKLGITSPGVSSVSIPGKSLREEQNSRIRREKYKLRPTSSSAISNWETDQYRVRYQYTADELPHFYGLDALQELFVPYEEHDREKDEVVWQGPALNGAH